MPPEGGPRDSSRRLRKRVAVRAPQRRTATRSYAGQLTQTGQAAAVGATARWSAVDELVYPVGTRVRVMCDVGNAKAGSEGIVIGYYRRQEPEYALAIDGIVVTVAPASLELVTEIEN